VSVCDHLRAQRTTRLTLSGLIIDDNVHHLKKSLWPSKKSLDDPDARHAMGTIPYTSREDPLFALKDMVTWNPSVTPLFSAGPPFIAPPLLLDTMAQMMDDESTPAERWERTHIIIPIGGSVNRFPAPASHSLIADVFRGSELTVNVLVVLSIEARPDVQDREAWYTHRYRGWRPGQSIPATTSRRVDVDAIARNHVSE